MNMQFNRLLGKTTRALSGFLAMGFVLTMSTLAWAQLEVTEIMYDPSDANDNEWEWIEIRNTGTEDIDMDGWLGFNLGDGEVSNPQPTIVSNPNSPNTVIPAGETAVIYDGFHGTGLPGTFDDAPFRQAWGLSANVRLMAASFFPSLSNSPGPGQSIGFWKDLSDYQADLVDDGTGMGTREVGSFNNAQFGIDFSGVDFPSVDGMSSIAWTGNADYRTGANWRLSELGQPGVVTSVEVRVTGTLNSSADIGNPGITSGSAPANSLFFSEVMYNPSSSDSDWEWVEVYNNTGAAIDFASTPYVFDDDDNPDLLAANVTTGMIPDGSAAILFDADKITVDQFKAAWGSGINAIPVTDWTALTNGSGDTIALWDSFADYSSEPTTGQGRTTDNAATSLVYENDANGWPNDTGFSSIYLLDLGLDPNNGANWANAAAGDVIGSFNATEVDDPTGMVDFHPGGDIGSPGSFTPPGGGLAGDYDNDGLVGQGDLDLVLLNWGSNAPPVPSGWVNEQPSGLIGQTQLDGVLLNWGDTLAPIAANAVPEPTTLVLLGLSVAFLPLNRRQRS